MKTQYLIGVDLGTSASKAALYRTDGTLVTEASAEVPLYHPQPGVVEQKNDDFYQTAAQTVSECIRSSGIDARQVAAIAFDSQMAGIGTVDEEFKPATRFDSWLDMRCEPYIEYLEKEYRDLVTRLTGCPPTCDGGAKILWWKGERPDSYARIVKFLMPAAYVAGTMAGLRGNEAYIDHTFLHFTALVDAEAGEWSPELIESSGIDRDKLPRIVAPWDVIGEVTPDAARDFGLAPGTPIAAGAGDTAAGALGAGIVRPGMILDTAGTASVLAGCTDTFVADDIEYALLTMRSVIPGLWHPLAYIGGGGLALRWFRDEFYQPGEPEVSDDDLYAAMTAEAAEIAPGADGLVFSPHLGGRICPAQPAMRGAWVGFSWGHTRAHFFRAVLESVAFEYAYYLDILGRLTTDLELIEARVIGGGARSDVWNQIKASVLNVPYQRLARSEFAAWGSAMIAGRAVGIYEDLAETAAATTQPTGDAFSPQPEVHQLYRDFAQRYVEWQATLAETFEAQAGKP